MTITPLDLTAYHITGTRFIALGDKLNEIITALNSREEKEPTGKGNYPKIVKCGICGNLFDSESEEDRLCDVCFKKQSHLPDQREELERVINDSLPLNRPVVLPDITVLIDLILAKWNLTPKK